MTEPNRPRPVPGPARPVFAAAAVGTTPGGERMADPRPDSPSALTGLDRRPVAEHVALFEAEHARLQRELGTIDQL